MTEFEAKAKILAAAWAAVALFGANKAVAMLKSVISEIEDHQWHSR